MIGISQIFPSLILLVCPFLVYVVGILAHLFVPQSVVVSNLTMEQNTIALCLFIYLFYWRIVDLQYCANFCYIAKWFHIPLCVCTLFFIFSITMKMKIYKNENFLIVKVNKSMSHIFVCMQTQIHSKTQLTIWVGHIGNYLSISYSIPVLLRVCLNYTIKVIYSYYLCYRFSF